MLLLVTLRYFNLPINYFPYTSTILQIDNGDKMDVAEKNTFCQMAHQPSVILNPVNIAVLHSVFVEVVQLIVNVSTALIIEQVRLFKCAKGQIILKWFLASSISSNKRTKTSRHSSKKNSFVRFLEEFEDAKNHFEINWPLEKVLKIKKIQN